MRVIRKNFRLGNRVVFEYNNCLYTGTISSIGVKEYGITMLNASKNVTDHECILRIDNEVFIPKKNCMRTAEVALPYITDCTQLKRGYRTVEDAYKISRKKQIFPWYSINKFNDVFIKFDNIYHINRLIFIMFDKDSNDVINLYYRNVDGESFFEDMNGNKYSANWRYHKRTPKKYSKGFDEFDVVRIYVLNHTVNVYDEKRIHALLKKGFEDVSDLLYKYENIPNIYLKDNKKAIPPQNIKLHDLDCFGERKTGYKSNRIFIDEVWYDCINKSKNDEKAFEKLQGFDVNVNI